MNTPTPEDIALAKEVNAAIWSSATPNTIELQAQLIADHCAPLRELAEIGRLAVEERRLSSQPERDHGAWEDALAECDAACDAYLAKEGA